MLSPTSWRTRPAEALSELFTSLLNMQGEEKSHALAVLKAALSSQKGEPWVTIRVIAGFTRTTAAFSLRCC
ncbi:type I phosphomannose isomerase helical insertion domain-containing protein [Shigella flexneri]